MWWIAGDLAGRPYNCLRACGRLTAARGHNGSVAPTDSICWEFILL